MATRSLINLTLEDIIKSKKNETNFEVKPRGSFRRRIGQQMSNSNVLKKSLSSRLSWNKPDNRRDERAQLRGGSQTSHFTSRQKTSGTRKLPVHSRLSLNGSTAAASIPNKSNRLTEKESPRRRNLMSRNANDSRPFRFESGTVVKGLRSDNLIMHKRQQLPSSRRPKLRSRREETPPPTVSRPRLRQHIRRSPEDYHMQSDEDEYRQDRYTERRRTAPRSQIHYGQALTVSIPNDVARVKRANRHRSTYETSDSTSNSSSSESETPVAALKYKKKKKQPARSTSPPVLRIPVERPPPPKPHRQILDPQIKREIAILQGHAEDFEGGPGPGVKNFKMVPVTSKCKLNDRFTQEKLAQAQQQLH